MKENHRTADRILDIFELLAKNKNGLTFSDISRQLSMPKSSLHPIIHTLYQRRFLQYKPEVQLYYLGDRIFSIGTDYIADSNLLNKIDQLLMSLAAEVNETSHFGVLSGSDVLYLLKQNPSSPIHVSSRSGYRLKAYCTAIGKALLSQFEMDTLLKFYSDPLEKITEKTIDSIDELYKQILDIRKTGFGYEKAESSPRVQCISTPIFDNNVILAAISVAFPIFDEKENLTKYEFIKSALKDTRHKVESIIAQNRTDWIYGD